MFEDSAKAFNPNIAGSIEQLRYQHTPTRLCHFPHLLSLSLSLSLTCSQFAICLRAILSVNVQLQREYTQLKQQFVTFVNDTLPTIPAQSPGLFFLFQHIRNAVLSSKRMTRKMMMNLQLLVY